MDLILGIDEAGRGPVIGPLVLGGVLIERSELKGLSLIGVRDSKRLTRTKRALLAEQITSLAYKTHLISIHPQKLDGNLNEIELAATCRLIRELRPDKVYLDAPVPPRGISGHVHKLQQLLGPLRVEIIAENRADAKYPVVAAASILAKVERDRAIEELRKQYGDFGWGYPSERKTRQFLRDWYAAHGDFPPCVRRRWLTVRRIIHECGASLAWRP
jgi:ribonuclease HII